MATKTREPEIYVARSSGVRKIDGETYRYYVGRTRIRAGHPLLRAVPGSFAPLALDYDGVQPPSIPEVVA